MKGNYQDYLNSSHWMYKRRKRLSLDNYQCYDCGDRATEVHHTSYDYMWQEEEIDYLMSLCSECHEERTKDLYSPSIKPGITRCHYCSNDAETIVGGFKICKYHFNNPDDLGRLD